MQELMDELDGIVNSGTKLRLDYYLNNMLMNMSGKQWLSISKEAETDSIEDAYQELKDDEITWEEIQLMRIKFLSDYAN